MLNINEHLEIPHSVDFRHITSVVHVGHREQIDPAGLLHGMKCPLYLKHLRL